MSSAATPLLEIYQNEARAAAKVVESWEQARPDPTRFAQDVDDIVAAMADEVPSRMERMYQRAWRRAAQGPLTQCGPVGEAVFGVWDSFTAVLRSVRTLALSLAADGHPVPHLTNLDSAIDRLERNRVRANDSWPWFRPEDEAAALIEHARGESLSLEDVFGGLSTSTRYSLSEKGGVLNS
jgi:hypothetical protein